MKFVQAILHRSITPALTGHRSRAAGSACREREKNLTLHRYAIGDAVRFTPARSDRSSAPAGSYRITQLLPEEQGDYQYRVKSAHDAHERIVLESQLDLKQLDQTESAFKK